MTCDNKIIEIKTGSEADFSMLYTDNQKPPVPLSLAGFSISIVFTDTKTGAVLKKCSTEDTSIVITEIEGNDETIGTYSVFGGSTTDWQLGEMPVDIKYTFGGKSHITEDFLLKIIPGRS